MSTRTQITFISGVLPHDPDRPHLLLEAILTASAAPPPASFDGLSAVPTGAWGMLGNDLVGDCTCAGLAHQRIADVHASQGTVLKVTDKQTLRFYENFGYRPGDPDSDRGALCQDVLETWQKLGFLGEKVQAFARVKVSNRTQVKQAISTLGPLYIGFTVTQSAEDQFNAGQPWSLVPGSPELGGHCVIVGSYDDDYLTCVTWGALQRMSWAFFEAQASEAWALFGRDNVSATIDLEKLEAEFSGITGRHLAINSTATTEA